MERWTAISGLLVVHLLYKALFIHLSENHIGAMVCSATIGSNVSSYESS